MSWRNMPVRMEKCRLLGWRGSAHAPSEREREYYTFPATQADAVEVKRHIWTRWRGCTMLLKPSPGDICTLRILKTLIAWLELRNRQC